MGPRRPAHWSDAWLGRPWVHGEFECVDLLHLARASIGCGWPYPREWIADARRGGHTRRAAMIAVGCADWPGARALGAGEDARDGDIAVMRYSGGARAGHVGVMCAPAGPPARHVLHCHEALGVVRHDPAALAAIGLRLDAVLRAR